MTSTDICYLRSETIDDIADCFLTSIKKTKTRNAIKQIEDATTFASLYFESFMAAFFSDIADFHENAVARVLSIFNSYGIYHHEDMITVTMHAIYHKIKGTAFDIGLLINELRSHWYQKNIDPDTLVSVT